MEEKYNYELQTPLISKEQPQINSHSRFKGIMFSLLSTIFLHAQKLFSKLAMEQSNVSPYQVMYFRSFVVCSIVIFIPLCKKKVSYLDLSPRVLKTALLRGFVNVWGGLSLYLALQLIPYSEAVLLTLLKPVFGSLLACVILGERILSVQVVALTISLVAIYVYADPGGYLNGGIPRAQDFKDGVTPGNPLGIFLGILKGFLAGLGAVFLRKLGKEKTGFQVPVFSIGLMGVIFMPMLVIPQQMASSTNYNIPPLALFYLIMVGCCLALGQSLVYIAYKYQKASTVLLIQYSEIIFALFSDLVIFESTLRATDYIATGLIFIGIFIISLNKCRKS